MARKFSEDFYVFLTPKNNSNTDENSYIKIIDVDCPYVGVIFRINWIKIDKKIFGGHILKFDYDIIEKPKDEKAITDSDKFERLLGDMIIDIWEKFYS